MFDHLAPVVRVFAELEIGDCTEDQIAHDFEECNISVDQAVKVIVLTGRGFIQQGFIGPLRFSRRCRPIGSSGKFAQSI
jgi:hypothetical protein